MSLINRKWQQTLLSATLACLMPLGFTSAAEPAGLVARYCFDTDLTTDCSGNLNSGIVSGDVTLVPGHYGQAARFGGYTSLGYIRVPNSKSLTLNKNFSIAYWARMTSFAGIDAYNQYRPYGLQIPLAKSHDRTGLLTELVPISATSNPGLTTLPLAVPAVLVGSGSIDYQVPQYDLGDWLHVVYTYKSSDRSLRIYVNGRSVSKTVLASADLTAFSQNDLYLGAQAPLFGQNVYQYPFEGLLDEVRLYNRTLTQTDVTKLLTGSY